MAHFRITAVRESHFVFEVSARNGVEAASKGGDMIRAGQVEPEEVVLVEIDVKKLSS